MRRTIKLIVTDCDGVLTTDKKLYTEDGKLIKKFSTKDTTAIRYLERNLDIKTCVLSGDDRVNEKFCEMHRLPFFKSVQKKDEELRKIAQEKGVPMENVLFIGDDLPDVDAGKAAGVFLCPSDAAPIVSAMASLVAPVKGGDGIFSWIYTMLATNKSCLEYFECETKQ